MGHVDHGKTKLLDAIRNTNVVAGEAGGITQAIGAYQVATEVDGLERKITFIDTPGHEAFTAMRARGAKSTDIAVLVVAADDGVMPQTIEALNHAKAAEVPIVVAVNKIDKESADPTKVRGQLTEYGLVPEEYGGDTMFVDVSATARLGLDELLEAVVLTADASLDLRANPDMPAQGVAIEAHLDKGRGPVATVLVHRGTLRTGDSIVAGSAHGRVRAMINDLGEQVAEAPPSMPVQVLGLTSVPGAGDNFLVVDDDRMARQIADKREARQRAALLAKTTRRKTLDQLFEQSPGDAAGLARHYVACCGSRPAASSCCGSTYHHGHRRRSGQVFSPPSSSLNSMSKFSSSSRSSSSRDDLDRIAGARTQHLQRVVGHRPWR